MPTPTKGPRLGGSPAHEKLMLANLATLAVQARPDPDHRDQGQAAAPAGRASDHQGQARRPGGSPRGPQDDRRDKDIFVALFEEIAPRFANRQRRLHPDREDRPAQGRRRSDGDHRAGRGARGGRSRRRRRRPPRPPRRRPRRRTRSPCSSGEADEPPTTPPTRPTVDGTGGLRLPRPTRADDTSGAPRAGTLSRGARAAHGGWTMVRVRLDVAYDGTDFSGWAAQPGRRTVAGVLLDRAGEGVRRGRPTG